MTPVTYDITIRRGNDFEQLFEFQQSDGSPMDLTAWTVKSQIRLRQKRDAELLEEFLVTISDPTNGKVYLGLTDAETDVLAAGTRYYDILLTSPSGFDEIYVEGKVTIKCTVTVKA